MEFTLHVPTLATVERAVDSEAKQQWHSVS